MERIVGKIRKNAANEIWVVLTDYTGEMRLNVREYFHDGGDAGFRPTRRGVLIPVSEIPALRNALDLLAESTEPGTVATFSKTGRTEIQAGLRKYQGHTYAEVRLFFASDSGNGEYRPSNKGVTMPLSLVPVLADAVGEAEEAVGGKNISTERAGVTTGSEASSPESVPTA
jgi:hypothetical protein